MKEVLKVSADLMARARTAPKAAGKVLLGRKLSKEMWNGWRGDSYVGKEQLDLNGMGKCP